MSRKRKTAKQFNSFKDMSIEEFDLFVSCVQSLIRNAPDSNPKYVELFYSNRITREFRIIYSYKPYVDGYAYYDWKFDSNEDIPEWSQQTIENGSALHARRTVEFYRFWAIYKLLCLYFLNDMSLLENLYERARNEAIEKKQFYEEQPQWRKRRELQYGEKFSISSYTRQALRDALAEESGYGRLYRAPIYKRQAKNLGMVKIDGWWQDNIKYTIKPTTNSILGKMFYRCFGESIAKARKALSEIDTKINAFLKQKEEKEEHDN